ncbi:Aspartyl aminopeptidase [Caloramator quimbayensis]|uniref:M18 family aminopeptidase n=1 Tax=Caloramator quimbayensis TaxID=1147123 RepID=A0A1T4X3S7_9CLOT|nr:aminopeptidase [Caloramator quimbayensis]SKA83788.1 Aspartyl aminopeptidase [Caloramator quimbayensis]
MENSNGYILNIDKKSVWEYRKNDKKLNIFAEEYKNFISIAKTERRTIDCCVKTAKQKGFVDIDEVILSGKKLKKGDKVYKLNRGKGAAFFFIGSEPFNFGIKVIAAHTDTPRLDLKPRPLYEDNGLAMLDTHYYGSIKKYQWTTIPLSLHGIVIKKDGSLVDINIGEDVNEPVFYISDLLIHLAEEQMQKPLFKGIEGEDLNIILGNMPFGDCNFDDRVKYNILNILYEKYGIIEEDLIFAEIEAVPAGTARDAGLDRSMIASYGQDDRLGVYSAFRALLDSNNEEKTKALLLVDKEETGNFGSTGAKSKFFEYALFEILELTSGYNEFKLLETLRNSKMLSIDAICAYDPNYSFAFDINNSAFLGCGVVLNKYNGVKGKCETNDADIEFLSYLRKIFDENDIVWQHAEFGKVDAGGSETISYILGQYGAQAADISFPLLSMHSPLEVSSKADIYELYRACKAFFQSKK